MVAWGVNAIVHLSQFAPQTSAGHVNGRRIITSYDVYGNRRSIYLIIHVPSINNMRHANPANLGNVLSL